MKRLQLALRVLDLAAIGTLVAALVLGRRREAVSAPPAKPEMTGFTLADWRAVLKRTALETQKDRLTTVSGGVTFALLLAIFPMLGAFVSLYGLFSDPAEVGRQLARLSRALPPGVVDLIGEQMIRLATARDSTLGLAFLISLVLALWSAHSGMGALFEGLNAAYGQAEKRPWWRLNLVTLGCTVTGVALLTLLAAGATALPAWLGGYGYELDEIGALIVGGALMLAVTIAALAGLYRWGPSHGHPGRHSAWPGATLAAGLWIVGSVAFSAYVSAFGHYEKTYGSLGAIIGFMLWIWCSVLAILVGAELNAEIDHQAALPINPSAPARTGSLPWFRWRTAEK